MEIKQDMSEKWRTQILYEKLMFLYVLFSYKKRCKDDGKRPYEGGVAAPIRDFNPALIDTLCNLVPR